MVQSWNGKSELHITSIVLYLCSPSDKHHRVALCFWSEGFRPGFKCKLMQPLKTTAPMDPSSFYYQIITQLPFSVLCDRSQFEVSTRFKQAISFHFVVHPEIVSLLADLCLGGIRNFASTNQQLVMYPSCQHHFQLKQKLRLQLHGAVNILNMSILELLLLVVLQQPEQLHQSHLRLSTFSWQFFLSAIFSADGTRR